METKTTHTIHQLCAEGVIIEAKVTTEWNDKEVTLDEGKTYYPNTTWGREALLEAVENNLIIEAVMITFSSQNDMKTNN